MNYDTDIIKQGIAAFGEGRQAMKSVEEMGELIKVVAKAHVHPEIDFRGRILDELADVLITLQTLRHILRISDEELQPIIDLKQATFLQKHLTKQSNE